MPGAVASGLHRRTNSASSTSRPNSTIRIASRNEISVSSHWQEAFAHERKDHRFYELLEDMLKGEFKYGYLNIKRGPTVCAIQPYLVDQDLLASLMI